MLIQYVSDLHLEFPQNKKFLKQNPLQPKGEILLLAGDIIPFAVMDEHQDFFDFVSDNFKTTYWIPGNHEFYNSDINSKPWKLNEQIRENVFLVNNVSVLQKGIKFIFTTLWSEIKPANAWQIERNLNDFHLISFDKNRFTSEHFNQLHFKSLDFLKSELDSSQDKKTVIVSHHVPTFYNYPEEYKNSPLNEAFAVELFDLIENLQPDYWIYGHTHVNTTGFNIGKTQLLTNQLGYVEYKEHFSFQSLLWFAV